MFLRGLLENLRLNDFAATQAGRASADVFGRRSHLRMNRAQIDVPAPFAHVVGVADGVTELRPLAANIANSCHNSMVPSQAVAETSILQEPDRFRQPPCNRVVVQFEIHSLTRI
jgi:hypothetical protein